MGIWVAEFFDGSASSPSLILELVDFSLALEAAREIENANKRQFVRLRPPKDATSEQLQSLLSAGALIVSKAESDK
jgi:hypothetical protein